VEWLNYHHLLYFHHVVREGGVGAAARRLRVAQPTVSAQIRQLETSIGAPLFRRDSRRLELTETGVLVQRYASEIFGLGEELLDLLQDRPAARGQRLVVGVADALPKLLVHRFLEPALRQSDLVRLICRQDRYSRLLDELAAQRLDLVLTDAPIGPAHNIKAFNHLLGESRVAFFVHDEQAARLKRNFPDSLDRHPFLFPAEHTALRRSLDHWFSARSVRPKMLGEFDDSALLKTFGQVGLGVFAAPAVIARQLRAQYGVTSIGEPEGLRERFYAITIERRIRHPGVQAIAEAAHDLLER
jgi:LysR family transcriptional regulator, transcriptional activator of nhaA